MEPNQWGNFTPTCRMQGVPPFPDNDIPHILHTSGLSGMPPAVMPALLRARLPNLPTPGNFEPPPVLTQVIDQANPGHFKTLHSFDDNRTTSNAVTPPAAHLPLKTNLYDQTRAAHSVQNMLPSDARPYDWNIGSYVAQRLPYMPDTEPPPAHSRKQAFPAHNPKMPQTPQTPPVPNNSQSPAHNMHRSPAMTQGGPETYATGPMLSGNPMYPAPTTHQSFQNSPAAFSPSATYPSTTSYNPDMKYDSVSPAGSPYNPPMGLQDLADISSNRPKMPMQSHMVANPNDVVMNSLTGDMMTETQAACASLAPVQAVADSTTKKGGRGSRKQPRKRKGSQQNTEVSPTKYNEYQTISTQDLVGFNSVQASSIEPTTMVNMEPVMSGDVGMGVYNRGQQGGRALQSSCAVAAEEDDEFSHLAPRTKPAATQVSAKETPVSNSSFQNSFMSFLEGKKPETLSSVTNLPVVNKPVLPKYIPEPPRPPKPPVSQPTTSTVSAPKPSVSMSSVLKSPLLKSGSNATTKPTTTQTVTGPGRPVSNTGLQSQTGRPDATANLPSKRGLKHGVPTRGGHMQSGHKVTSQPAHKATPGTNTPSARGRPKGRPPSVKKKERSPSPIFIREKTSRRAKEKSQEAIKKEYLEDESSEENLSPADVICYESYDSDKDPMWNPTAQTEKSVSSDDERWSRSSTGGAATHSAKKHSKTKKTPSKAQSTQKSVPPQGGSSVPQPRDYDQPHDYQRGCFVLDRRDLGKHERFDIWRVDAGRLLQKYEGSMEDGRLVHRASTTYTSWSDSVAKSHRAIGVTVKEEPRGTEQGCVEVIEKYRPRPPDNTLEAEPLMEAFNVYIQSLVSQALKTSFLATVHKQQDEYYVGSLSKVDDTITIKLVSLLNQCQWTPVFQKSIDLHPHMIVTSVYHKVPCQACCTSPATSSLHLSGADYDHNTMEPRRTQAANTEVKFNVCETGRIRAVSYHRLQHYKHNLLQHCQLQVHLLKPVMSEMSIVLDHCLQHRVWVHEHFRELMKLLNLDGSTDPDQS